MPHNFCVKSPKERSGSERPLLSVVDDDQSMRESLPDLIKEFGFAARAFSSAEEFLSSGSANETSCLILDIAMPGMSGPELHQELKRRGETIPTIFITGENGTISLPTRWVLAIVPFVIRRPWSSLLGWPGLSRGVAFPKLSKLLNQEHALSAPCLKHFRNYSGPIRVARCGFPWEKTTKRPVASPDFLHRSTGREQ